MTTTSESAVNLLQTWLTGDTLAPQREVSVGRYDFAASIKPVAEGMLAMALADTKEECTAVVDVVKGRPYSIHDDIVRSSRMVVVFNRKAASNSDVFAPDGPLGLKLVTLQVGVTRRDDVTAQLCLFMPLRTRNPLEDSPDSYGVVAIRLDGSTSGYRYYPRFWENGYLRYALGLISLEQAVRRPSSSLGSVEDVMVFPGALDYLAVNLPALGRYFTALAEAFGSDGASNE